MQLSVVGNDETGYWVNLGPGTVRLGQTYATYLQAEGTLSFQARTCGCHDCDTTAMRATIREATVNVTVIPRPKITFLHPFGGSPRG